MMATMTPATMSPMPSTERAVSGVISGPRGSVPVSYTHLRAHETVLDLVCRLLLEKKNKDSDTQIMVRKDSTINSASTSVA